MELTGVTSGGILVAVVLASLCGALHAAPGQGPVTVDIGDGQHSKIVCWLESSLKRVYPQSPIGQARAMTLLSPRNARVSFQACLRNQSTCAITVDCSVTAPEDLKVSIRRVGYVPMWNHTADVPMTEQDGVGFTPGLVPDPLYPEHSVTSGPWGNQSFWITVSVPQSVSPGARTLTVHLTPAGAKEGVEAKMDVNIDVRPLTIKPRRDFPVTHWWNADCIYDWYKVKPFGDEWFKLTENYMTDMVAHGSDVIFVPVFHHRREVVERPSQLLIVTSPKPGKYKFDWTRVRRFVAMARRSGFTRFEWPHLWHMKITPEGAITAAAEPQRVYLDGSGKPKLMVPAYYPATGEDYVRFLKQFLPEFHKFLIDQKLLEVSYFHVSDEPGGSADDLARYKAVRNMLHDLAPWTDGKVIDAMSDVNYGKMHLIDGPVPNVQAAKAYIDAGIPHWVYYCCGPRGEYLNRFFDTPLAKIRMSGWLFYHLKALGFLHWGYNFWYVMDLGFNPVPQKLVDPFTDGAAGTTSGGAGEPYGDSFVVYPGENGPIDSIRWEVFAESLQDYAMLQSAGVKPDDPMLAELKDYADFPKSQRWIDDALGKVLNSDRHH